MKINGQSIGELLFSAHPEGVVVINHKGEIVLCNENFNHLFGYASGSLQGQYLNQIIPKEYRQQHDEHLQRFFENPSRRPMGFGVQFEGLKKDGSILPIEVSLNYLESEKMAIGIVSDITKRVQLQQEVKTLNQQLEKKVDQRTSELRRSQQLYQIIAQNFPNGTINLLDKNYNYVFVNGEDIQKAGVSPESFIGKNFIELLPKEIAATMLAKLDKVQEGENQIFEIEIKKGVYQVIAVGITEKTNQISQILVVDQNITQRKKMEERMKTALKKERELGNLKTRFVSMASHEFKTPLTTILSSLDLINRYREKGQEDKQIQHLEKIRKSVYVLNGILSDFLSLSRIEENKVSLKRESFDLLDLIVEVGSEISSLNHRETDFSMDLGGLENFVMVGDTSVFRLIVTNLLSNAFKYSIGGQKVHLKLQVKSGLIQLEISDQGRGIAIDDQVFLFERFFRAAGSSDCSGTGLGLYIVKNYTDLLGGKIEFSSLPEEGTSFKIELPYEQQKS